MKLRTGFISNSSTTSFTIYGWSEEMLQEFFAEKCQFFKGVTMFFEENEIINNLIEEYPGSEWDINSGRAKESCQIFGIGGSGHEVDHGMNPLENGHYYPEPTDEQKKEMDRIAEKFGLPKPKLFRETYY